MIPVDYFSVLWDLYVLTFFLHAFLPSSIRTSLSVLFVTLYSSKCCFCSCMHAHQQCFRPWFGRSLGVFQLRSCCKGENCQGCHFKSIHTPHDFVSLTTRLLAAFGFSCPPTRALLLSHSTISSLILSQCPLIFSFHIMFLFTIFTTIIWHRPAGKLRQPSRLQRGSRARLLGVCLFPYGDHVHRRLRRHCLHHKRGQGVPDPLPWRGSGKYAERTGSPFHFLVYPFLFLQKN